MTLKTEDTENGLNSMKVENKDLFQAKQTKLIKDKVTTVSLILCIRSRSIFSPVKLIGDQTLPGKEFTIHFEPTVPLTLPKIKLAQTRLMGT